MDKIAVTKKWYFIFSWTMNSFIVLTILVIAVYISPQNFIFHNWLIFVPLFWVLQAIAQQKALNLVIKDSYLWGLATIRGGAVNGILFVIGWLFFISLFEQELFFNILLDRGGGFTLRREIAFSGDLIAITCLFFNGIFQGVLQQKSLEKYVQLINFKFIPLFTGVVWALPALLSSLFIRFAWANSIANRGLPGLFWHYGSYNIFQQEASECALLIVYAVV